ncbi:hypothetical protein OKW21_004048 [Catalinimonas alkaloidigena]|uniref:hypothetical protein n=1 Tax=Catalinimonas alkaloidigena TaxID=1075417 RepID=UPI002404D538|nr:hypothetical protein [Catalinimonas alkaloidigena]MDF9798785.1 hypothetical protein [Catalinimonas alkaloidigena]
MKIVLPENKPPVIFEYEDKFHARMNHDYATWHPDPHPDDADDDNPNSKPKTRYVDKILAKTNARLPGYEKRRSGHQLDNKADSLEKSKFNSFEILEEAVLRSAVYPAIVANNRLLVTTFDMGYVVGYDSQLNSPTSTVTVVTYEDGKLKTVYPGKPSYLYTHKD